MDLRVISILLLQLAMFCAAPTSSPALAEQPAHHRKRPANSPYQSGSYSSWRSRKIRILQKLLRHLTPREMSELAIYVSQMDNDNKPHGNGKGHATHKRRHTLVDREWNTVDSSGAYMDSTEPDPIHRAIECPSAEDGLKLFACPSPDEDGVYRCIDDHALCDHHPHCPNAEDEDPTVCMFHKMTMNYFKVLMDAVFGLSRSVV